MARFADGVVEIKRMFVRPPARSRGIAGELLAELESAARTRATAGQPLSVCVARPQCRPKSGPAR
jgi:GNAT superfamily N-acetyltransferase